MQIGGYKQKWEGEKRNWYLACCFPPEPSLPLLNPLFAPFPTALCTDEWGLISDAKPLTSCRFLDLTEKFISDSPLAMLKLTPFGCWLCFEICERLSHESPDLEAATPSKSGVLEGLESREGTVLWRLLCATGVRATEGNNDEYGVDDAAAAATFAKAVVADIISWAHSRRCMKSPSITNNWKCIVRMHPI